jgi:hypothetical protein
MSLPWLQLPALLLVTLGAWQDVRTRLISRWVGYGILLLGLISLAVQAHYFLLAAYVLAIPATVRSPRFGWFPWLCFLLVALLSLQEGILGTGLMLLLLLYLLGLQGGGDYQAGMGMFAVMASLGWLEWFFFWILVVWVLVLVWHYRSPVLLWQRLMFLFMRSTQFIRGKALRPEEEDPQAISFPFVLVVALASWSSLLPYQVCVSMLRLL